MGNDWEPWARIGSVFGAGGIVISIALRFLSRSFSAERVQIARDDGERRGVLSLHRALEECEKREKRVTEERDRYYEKWQQADAIVDARDETISSLQERIRDLTREVETLRQAAYRPPPL